MSYSLSLEDKHPRKDPTIITQIGLKAYDLGLSWETVIHARLPSILTRLSADLTTLGVVVPGALQARNEAKAATTTQNVVLKLGYERVRAIRLIVRRAGASKDVRRAYGVGQKTNPNLVRDVKAALQQIVDRAKTAPEEAAAFGFTAEAVAELDAFLSTLIEADKTQESKRARAPRSTKERNLTANRVLQSAVLIAGAGMLAFVADPLVHANFNALMTSTRRTGTPKEKPLPEPGEALEVEP